ncbi:MAG: hypothetical protein IT324_13950 [Anaerolineae bacterium]|nr:hypothetical protein [Anaerolineae bacterium]
MSDLLIQVLGLAILLAGMGWGYWHWIHARPALGVWAKLLLLLLVTTLFGGLIGSTGWWVRDPRSFSWLLPPLASRMLAAAAWSFALVTFLALRRPVYRRVRLALVMLFVYFVPLVVAIILFHLDRFDFAAPITYAFFTVVIGMTVLTILYLFRQPVITPETTQDVAPAYPLTRLWLLIVAVVMLAWGTALCVTDAGPSALIWVWPGDLLSSRLISVMLLTIAAGAVYGAGAADTARVMLWVIVIYSVGVAAANLWGLLDNKPIKEAYVAVFAIIALVSAALWITQRQPQTKMAARSAS